MKRSRDIKSFPRRWKYSMYNVTFPHLEHLQQCLKLVTQIEIWGFTQEKLLQQCPISKFFVKKL
jgi:hypothetical protein